MRILSTFVLMTAVFSIHAGDAGMPKESFDGWSKICRRCTPYKKTFFTQKDDIRCIVSYDLEHGTYKWTRIQMDPTQETFNVEEIVESQEPLDMFNKMEQKFLQEQKENEADLLAPFIGTHAKERA